MTPLRLVLVEDNPADARLVREHLRDAGAAALMAVEHAPTLAAAREVLAAEPADCVLLDLSLPDGHGLGVLAEVRRAAPDTPVVVLSGAGDAELAVQAVQAGAQDYLVKDETTGPLLLRAIRYAIERAQAEARLAALALRDPLTGLANRTLLLRRTHEALERAGGRPGVVAMLFLDLDRFKLVNDSLGHEAGDALLVGVAGRLAAATRPGDTVARFGGDEFAVLCEDVPGPAALEAVVAELRRALAAPLVVSGHEVYPAGSIGVAVASGDDHSPERLLREADEAMYQAKAARRSTATYDAAGQEDAARHALRTEAELHRALRHGELELHYQPQVGLTPRRPLRGLEALVRWRHPEHGLIGPDAFLATAEDTGLIRRLGAWVLDEACGQLAAWRALGLTDAHIPVTVNLSPRQLDDEALGNLVRAALVTHGLEPGALCLEITESSLLEEGSEAIARLEDLKALGVRIAVDDFGTGWSSLANLGRVPVDALKIDRVFVRAMETDDAARRIVAAVLGVARSMGLEAIAEGVETPSLAHALAGMGCATAQGHAFAPAAKAAEIEALLAAEAEARDARGPLRVFLCDDAPSLRRLLRSYLEAEPDLRVVGEAADGAHLTERVREAGADCVVLDLSMPRVDGLEALAELRANDPDIAIVVLSGFEARHMEAQVLALGADRYVAKRAGMRDVRAVIRDVVAARRGPASVLEGLA